MDYKKTLLLPRTDFEMRGNLIKKEPQYLKFWQEEKIYEKALNQKAKEQIFTLHDGPPYANGNIHVGHALNKILKDFVVKSKLLTGYYTKFVPGWDTHGLPIEQKITESGVDRKSLSTPEFRLQCLNYAKEQIDIQKKQMLRLGLFGFFDTPYVTFKKEYEAKQISIFLKMYEKGLIFKGLKPIYWSPSSESALAEAEIIYNDKKAFSIYVPFTVSKDFGPLKKNDDLIIWTTTPWTLPANSGIAIDEKVEYSLVKYHKQRIVIATATIDKLEILWNVKLEKIKSFKGKEIINLEYDHPFYEQKGKVVHGFHIDLTTGTGLVHMAPSHGPDDYIIAKNNDLKIYNLIDDKGHFKADVKLVGNMFWAKANKIILNHLKESNKLIFQEEIIHSYPHDWRTKKPVMYRATPQWFCSIEKIRNNILKEISNVKWASKWGNKRLTNMMNNRQDWCISRQRVWGVPIPIIYGEDKQPILDKELNQHFINLFKEYGSNIWFEKEVKDLLPKNYKHKQSPHNEFTKEKDTMDVWFDSGSSSFAVSQQYDLKWPFDLYLEGSDQYRGWFNSSLITGVATKNQSPYKEVLSHGFVLDGKGEKMSKSKGNVIDPLQVTNNNGADILRLWVASTKFQADVRISQDILKQTSEQYRSIRFKIRFALSNLFDYEENENYIKNLTKIDWYFIDKINKFNQSAKNFFNNYQYNALFVEALNLLNDLSVNYFDFAKDILYVYEKNDPKRKNIQFVLHYFLKHFLIIMAPIISFTCEEAYKFFNKKDKKDSIFLEDWPQIIKVLNREKLQAEMDLLLDLKKDVLKEMEIQRNNKIIGKPSEAKILFYFEEANIYQEEWKEFLMASKVEIRNKNDFNGNKYGDKFIKIEKYQGITCDRCWLVFAKEEIKNNLCLRCVNIVEGFK